MKFKTITALITALAVFMGCFTAVLADGGGQYVFIDELKGLENTYSSSKVNIICSSGEKYGDTSRITKSSRAQGEIVYNISKLKSLYITAYETVEVRGKLTVNFSSDGENWTAANPVRTVQENYKWDKAVYAVRNVPGDTLFVKIALPATSGHSEGAISPEEIQLGEIKFVFDKDGGFANIENACNADGLNAVFYDKMDALSDKWIVSEAHKNFVKATDFDGGKYITLTNSSSSGDSGSTDTYITADDLNLNGKVYLINFKMAADNTDFDRNVIIATNDGRQNGTYLYPICFGTSGRIGYRDATFTYKDFPVSYNYDVNTVYDISIILDTVNARENVYINGTLVTPTPVSLANSANGGISQIKLANMEKSGVSGNTYFSSFICEEKVNMLNAVNGVFEFADMAGEWSDVYAKNLVYQNIMDFSDYFNPNDKVTVKDFLGWVLRAYSGEKAEFDVIARAEKAGIVKAGEFTDANAFVTREQMAYLLSGVVKENAENASFYDGAFADYNSISDKYRDGVKKAAALGIVSTAKGDMFNGSNYAVRAEAAAMVSKAFCPTMRKTAGYTIGIYAGSGFENQAKKLHAALKDSYDTKIITNTDLTNGYVLNTNILSCVVFMNEIDVSARGVAMLHSYLENGGDMVVLGENLFNTLNMPNVKIPIFEAYGQPQLNYNGGVKIKTAEGQQYFDDMPEFNGSYSGTSAVGYVFADNSKYIPVLEVSDKYDRRLGYAAGTLIEYDGQYRGGSWLFYGIKESDFYNTDDFVNSVKSVLAKFNSSEFLDKFSRDEEVRKNIAALENYEITEPRPQGYVHVSDDGKSFIDADGNELFVVGQNIYGLSEYCYSSGDQTKGTFSIEKMEQQFKLSSEAGVNVYRLWWPPYFEPEEENRAAKVIINLARKYRIYLFIAGPGGNETLDDLAWYNRYSKTFGDEPMVIGYDLMNEPNVQKFLISFGGNLDNPMLKYDLFNRDEVKKNYGTYTYLLDKNYKDFIPLVEKGIVSEEVRTSAAAAEALLRKVVFTGNLYSFSMYDNKFNPDTPQWIVDMLREVAKKGIDERREAIRKNAPHALVTVGYYNFVAMIPGVAESLDFWNHHTYVKPDTFENVKEQLNVYDIQRNLSDKIPSILGEFGLTDGHFLADGSQVRNDTVGGYQFLMWIYAWANGFGGGLDWMGSPRNPTAYRYYNIANWSFENNVYLERHSIYYYDGNPETQMSLQPQGEALKFFKKFRKTHRIGDGNLSIYEDNTQLKAGYNFEADTAQYICGSKFKSDRLEYTTDDNSSPLLLLDWACDKLIVEATKDMTVRIKPQAYLSALRASKVSISGKYQSVKTTADYVVVNLLANEKICITNSSDNLICVSK